MGSLAYRPATISQQRIGVKTRKCEINVSGLPSRLEVLRGRVYTQLKKASKQSGRTSEDIAYGLAVFSALGFSKADTLLMANGLHRT